jgi:3-dehydroquinate synthetase
MERTISVEALLVATMRDKKAMGGRLALVMPGATGALEIVGQDFNPWLSQTIETYLKTYSIVLP